jgi:hypothetical protein
VYFRAIGQGLAAPNPKGTQGQATLCSEFSRVDTAWLPHIIAETHSQEYNVYFRAMGQRLAALDPRENEGQPVFRS